MKNKATPAGTRLNRWGYLIAGFFSMLFAGVIYAWSILKAPLAASFGWTPSALALNFTITMCFFCGGGILSGMISKKVSPRTSALYGAVLAAAGFILASRISGENILMLYLSYGCLAGVGIGMAYNSVVSTVSAWFPDRKGVCSGVLMMGFGMSSLVLGTFAGKMMETEGIGWRGTYLILGCAIGLVLLLTALILRLPDENTALPQPKATAGKAGENDFTPREFKPTEMIRKGSFWRLYLFLTALSTIGSTVISFAKDFSLSVGATAVLSTALVGVLSICNGLGRIVFGLLFDSLGRRKTILLSGILTICAAGMLLAAVLSNSLALGVVGLCLAGFSYGSAPTITAVITRVFYGSVNFPMNFSVAFSILIPASFAATLAGSLVVRTGSYTAPFLMLLGFAIVSLILGASIKKP